MIAGGEYVRAEVEQLLSNLRRNSESPGSILSVDDDQLDIVSLNHVLDVLAHDPAPRAAEDVANEKDLQAVVPVP
jgi:hypothetical protein